ncbi:zinc D-Ala-D-Ala carboxypeptidase [Burkholderiales bacterium]|nr:zinc D-Ala-D-Ala carboxypeptidase [Burkholderiales bacterium]
MPNRPTRRPASASPAYAPSRRRVLAAGAVLLAAPMLALPRRSLASTASARTLAFRHTHTGESLAITYASGDQYVSDALARVNWFLRDFRNGDVQPIDPQLLDQLHAVSTITGSRAPYEVISGYRSPATNVALKERGRGVATHSLHLEGRAIDVRLADVPLADLRDAAMSLRKGGVGFYAASRFVHLDTGRVRRW